MNTKLLLIIALLISSIGNAQISFKGIVTEEDTSVNVTDAIVAIEGTTIAQRTDLNGAFNIFKEIPIGDQVVTITKEGYNTRYLLIEVESGKNIIMDNVTIVVNKKERKRREKAIKEQKKNAKKAEKEKEDLLADSKKEKEKKEKELEKQRKKLLKQKKKNAENIPVVENNTIPSNTNVTTTEITSTQIKYGAKLDVTPETISNTKLYDFIEAWEGTKYILGGENKEGIDCSSFSQRLYNSVYDVHIERTAQKQFDSKLTDKFLGKEFLREGDLLFFKGFGENKSTISHVGIYLHNGYFVHATSYSKDNGLSGVKISNLTNAFWTRIFVAGGRRQKN
ncbi:C40 family peptidase [Oceanihabitans sp. 2_MG-2023]|uniref:C40 family peptidase n=1 Tax=Oceanihabitans sp. 2_MG-2023 TaxID=3062661 RepID=UPI0026E3661B|nr:C40 family peptidase [Oceanihabitans sp. 2_MG-2023]MDO6597322.1 C40 family peptidase [Oceanihabitans sp. 2_MG-2023]